eukprot:1282308-Rhodomonas_salina.2
MLFGSRTPLDRQNTWHNDEYGKMEPSITASAGDGIQTGCTSLIALGSNPPIVLRIRTAMSGTDVGTCAPRL